MDFNVDKKGDWDWGAGVALYGLRKVYETTGSQEIYNFIKTFIDSNMANSQKISYNINTTAPLLSVLLLYRETGEPHYLDFAEKFASWLMKEAPRLSNGALEHTVINDKFAGEMWVDTVFMAGVFLTELGQMLNKAAYIEEGLLQVRLHIECLQTGDNGMWSTILNDASSYKETSATAGFVYGISKSVRMGYLDKKYLLCAEKGYKAVLRHISEEGTVQGVSAGTGIQKSILEYNTIPRQSIMPWGQGITLLMLCQEAQETT